MDERQSQLWNTIFSTYFISNLNKTNLEITAKDAKSVADAAISALSKENKHEDKAEHRAKAPKIEISIREREILDYISKGLCNKEIAPKLFISLHTVKWHVASLLKKFNAESRTDLLVKAIKSGAVTV